MSSGTSILKSIIQAANTRDTSRTGPWRTSVTVIGTTDGLKSLKQHIFIGHITRQSTLGASLCVYSPPFSNLAAIVKSIHVASVDLPSYLRLFLPDSICLGTELYAFHTLSLRAALTSIHAASIDLPSYLRLFLPDSVCFGAELNITYFSNLLGALTSIHAASVDLSSCLHLFLRDSVYLAAKLGPIPHVNIGASLCVIDSQNIRGILRPQRSEEDQFLGFIRGWRYDDSMLPAFIQPHIELDFPASLQAIQPADMAAYLKVWPYKNLRSDIQGYAVFDLLTRIRVFTKNIFDMPASTVGYSPANLMALLLPFRSDCYNMNAYIFAQRFFDLNASMNYVYRTYSGLCSIIEGLPIYLLNASIVGWAERSLSANISATIPSGYLKATIIQHGTYNSLSAIVAGFIGVNNSVGLGSCLSGWAQLNLTSFISSIEAVSLIASITPKGGTKDVSAYIKVREIIFSELYKFSTINTADLRAYVGFSLCSVRTPRSAYVSLLSFIFSVPIYDLGAVIKGVKTIYSGTKDLGVFIGYTNKYSMLVKFLSFKHSMSVSGAIKSNPAFFKDSLNITFKIIKGQQDLKTYITSVPQNASLGATIRSLLLIVHGTGTNKVLTEELVELEGSRRVWSEYIDVYLQSEKPIYYTAGEVFAQNYGDPIFSFLFKRVSDFGIRYNYTLPYDMFFTSTDEAIRYGFSKISSRTAFVGLGATVETNVKHLKLNAKIECKENIPLYLGSPFICLKIGTMSFMGTCINSTLYKSKLNVFGGIQDITSSVSAVAN
jgi:hypothetical protein